MKENCCFLSCSELSSVPVFPGRDIVCWPLHCLGLTGDEADSWGQTGDPRTSPVQSSLTSAQLSLLTAAWPHMTILSPLTISLHGKLERRKSVKCQLWIQDQNNLQSNTDTLLSAILPPPSPPRQELCSHSFHCIALPRIFTLHCSPLLSLSQIVNIL